MLGENTKLNHYRLVAVLGIFFFLVYFTIPLVEPEFTIQCVEEINSPCVIDNITIHERIFGLA